MTLASGTTRLQENTACSVADERLQVHMLWFKFDILRITGFDMKNQVRALNFQMHPRYSEMSNDAVQFHRICSQTLLKFFCRIVVHCAGTLCEDSVLEPTFVVGSFRLFLGCKVEKGASS